MKTVYLDNAATSFPKPEGVSDSMKHYIDEVGATINRSVYQKAADAGLVTLKLRESLARFYHFTEPATHVILTPGATWGLNMAIRGFLRPGDHCIVSSVEHNAVMRPLMETPGIEVSRIPCDRVGHLDPRDIEPLIRPNTKLLVMVHGSNVCGAVQDAAAVGAICKKHNLPFLLDAAQTSGHYPIDFEEFGLSALAAPGHKGLLGPSGIGVLLLRDDFAKRLSPVIAGGTGSASDSEYMPDYLPDRFEPGTPNLPGIYGLSASLRFVEETGVATLRKHEMGLCKRFLEGLDNIPGVQLIGPRSLEDRVGVISVDFLKRDNAEAAYELETGYGILTRCGLHCAPAAHKTLGTFPRGTVRFSIGFKNTEEDIDLALRAIAAVSEA